MNASNTRPPPDEDGSYQEPERRSRSRSRADDDAIERLEQIVQGMPQFTAEEQALVRQVLEAYRGWQVLGKAMKLLVLFLAGVSAVVVGFSNIKTLLKAWLI